MALYLGKFVVGLMMGSNSAAWMSYFSQAGQGKARVKTVALVQTRLKFRKTNEDIPQIDPTRILKHCYL